MITMIEAAEPLARRVAQVRQAAHYVYVISAKIFRSHSASPMG
jgi:hypothetical protein